MSFSEKFKKAFSLFITFFKIGAFTFGGGYAMIPLIQREVAEEKHWIDEGEILSMVAIAESTPGPVAINMATYTGYKIAGVMGSAFATFGVVLPSYIIISAISFVLAEFSSLMVVKYAFEGIRAGVLALLIKALVSMYKKCPKNIASYIVMAVSFIIAAFIDISVLWVILFCAIFGIVSSLIAERRSAK